MTGSYSPNHFKASNERDKDASCVDLSSPVPIPTCGLLFFSTDCIVNFSRRKLCVVGIEFTKCDVIFALLSVNELANFPACEVQCGKFHRIHFGYSLSLVV